MPSTSTSVYGLLGNALSSVSSFVSHNIHIAGSAQLSEAERKQIENYKNKSIVPDSIKFNKEGWAEAIQADIDALNHSLRVSYARDLVHMGSLFGLSFMPILPYIFVGVGLLVNFGIRESHRHSAVGLKLEKLISVFEKLTPEDTKTQIAKNLASAIAPLVLDEAVMLKWMKLEENSPRSAFRTADPEFIEILKTKGLVQLAVYPNQSAADVAFKEEEKQYNDSILEPFSLFITHVNSILYGKSNIGIEYKKQITFFAENSNAAEAKKPVVHEKLGGSLQPVTDLVSGAAGKALALLRR